MRTIARLLTLVGLACVFLSLPACATKTKTQHPMPVAAVAMPKSEKADKPLLVVDGEKQYTIDRDRPFRAGEQYDVRVHNTFDLVVSAKGLLAPALKAAKIENMSRTYDISGRVLIKSLDAKGKPAAFTFTIEKCLSGQKVLIPDGSVLEAKTTPGGVAITMPDGKKATREITQALLGVFAIENSTGNEDYALIDDANTPRKVGETWPLKLPSSAQRPIGEGARAQLTNMQITSTLKSLQPFHGILAAELENILSGTLKFEKLPMGFVAKASELAARQNTRYPTDSALPPLVITRELKAEITVEGTFLFTPVSANVKVSMNQELTPLISQAAAAR